MRTNMLLTIATTIALVVAGTTLAQDTPQPPKARGDGPAMMRPKAMARALELTPQQQAQVDAILDRARDQAQNVQDPQAKRRIHRAAMEEIKTTVLNEQQRTRLARIQQARRQQGAASQPAPARRPASILRELGLTPEQKARVKEIMQEAQAQAEKATEPQAKRQAHQAAMRKIYGTVLTPEQRAQFDEKMQAAGADRPAVRGKGPGKRPDGAARRAAANPPA